MGKLHYLEGFEKVNPDVFHEIAFDFSREFLEGKTCLNIGCWTGGFEQLAKRLSKSFLISIDVDNKALKIAKNSTPEVNFIEADVQNLPFKDGSLDVVTMFYVMEHLPKENESYILKEINRALKKKGRLLIATHNYQWLSNFLDIAYWVTGHRHYKIDFLKRMLSWAGFTVDKCELKGGFIASTSVVFFYLFKYIFKKQIYRDFEAVKDLFKKEYKKKGFRDIFLIAKK